MSIPGLSRWSAMAPLHAQSVEGVMSPVVIDGIKMSAPAGARVLARFVVAAYRQAGKLNLAIAHACPCCSEEYAPYPSWDRDHAACDGCLDAGCTERECFKVEQLEQPIAGPSRLTPDGIVIDGDLVYEPAGVEPLGVY